MTKRSKEETMKELLEVRMKMRKHYDKWRDVKYYRADYPREEIESLEKRRKNLFNELNQIKWRDFH